MESTPRHCPGFENLKGLAAFECKCPECGYENEIFSDEFDKPHTCKGCGRPIDFSRCELTASAGTARPS